MRKADWEVGSSWIGGDKQVHEECRQAAGVVWEQSGPEGSGAAGTLVKEVSEKRAGNRSSLPTFVYSLKSYLVLSSPSGQLFNIYGVFSLF